MMPNASRVHFVAVYADEAWPDSARSASLPMAIEPRVQGLTHE